MKHVILLFAAALLLAGCGDAAKSIFSVATPTPVPTPVPKAATPTPKPGNWMWKGYQNPLDAKKSATPPAPSGPRPAPR